MTNEELNTALYKKMFAEQEKYREWLLSQPPNEILNHCYEYTVREDIVLALEEYDLSDIYAMSVLALTLTMSMGVTAFAAGDPITVVNNLSDFIFGLIRAVSLILLGWGIVQVGLSFQSHDPSQRSNGFLTLAGGVIITFAKEILDLIVG